MTDRELTDAAAKAAGLWDSANDCIDVPWSPLTNDGDALRLVVKLQLTIIFNSPCVYSGGLWEEFGTDAEAATRRAIVRAAAAMSPHPVQGVKE